MPSPRIFVNGRFLTQPLTGIQRYSYELTRRMPQAVIVTPGPPSEEYPPVPGQRVKVAPSSLPHHLWEQAVLPGRVPKDALLWCPGGSGPWRGSRREVLTIHDLSVFDFPEGFSASYLAAYRALYAVLPRRVRRILTVSRFSKERIVEVLRVPVDRVGIVPNAPAAQFKPLERDVVDAALATLGVNGPYVLSLGAVSARKNFRRLFDAWKRISPRWPEYRLVVVGRSDLAFSNYDSLGPLPDRTTWLKHVSDEQLVALYNGAVVMAYPSLYEGFGLPVLEAMACGTAVLTSGTSALTEVAGEASHLVDPWSIEDIAAGVERLLANEGLRNELRRRGLARAATFTWEGATRALLTEIYS